jgi:membrane protease YdiL (CAAX protease family)
MASGASRALMAAELVLIAGLAAADYYGLVPITSTPWFILLGWISLRLRGRRWGDVGLAAPASWPRAILLGTAAGVAMELFSTFVSVPFLTRLTGAPPDLSDFRSTVGNLRILMIWLAVNWTLGAFGEELAFRGYVMNRAAEVGSRTRAAWWASLVFASVLFGWGHGGQGLTGMVQEGFAGLLLGIVYLASGRNLVCPIVAHGMANTLAFVLIYLGRYPGV